ncbi:MAG TPA: glycerate kinase [Chthoniobacterales bacterium]
MRVLISPDKFKGSLGAGEVATAIAAGLRDANLAGRHLVVEERPVADGGEGTASVLCEALAGRWVECPAHDALGRAISARYALSRTDGESLAILEMSDPNGLWRIDEKERRVLLSSSLGTGEVLMHALTHSHADRVVLGIGGSATNDGGLGFASALGFGFYGSAGEPIAPLPIHFLKVARIDLPPVPWPWTGRVTAMVDVSNPLLGENGATRVYGPQKGVVTQAEAESLEQGLEHFANLAAATFGKDFRAAAGAGAAGGLGFGLLTFAQAELRPGFATVAELLGLERRIAETDLVITGEGGMDAQTLNGKAPFGVAQLAQKHGKPCVAFAGRVDPSADLDLRRHFFDLISLANADTPPAEAIRCAPELLRARAAEFARGFHLP